MEWNFKVSEFEVKGLLENFNMHKMIPIAGLWLVFSRNYGHS
jgi:hypothetical protein